MNGQDRDDEDKSEGYWREFFLLKPDNERFGQLLDDLEAIDLLHASVRILRQASRAGKLTCNSIIANNSSPMPSTTPDQESHLQTRMLLMYVIHLAFESTLTDNSELDSIPDQSVFQEVHKSQLRHYRSSSWT